MSPPYWMTVEFPISIPIMTPRGERSLIPSRPRTRSVSSRDRQRQGRLQRRGLSSSFLAGVAIIACLVSGGVSADPLAQREQKWAARFESVTAGADDVALDGLVDDQGNVLVVGTTNDRRNGPVCLIQKYAAGTGTLLWERLLSALGPVVMGDAVLDSAGALVLAGVGPATTDSQHGTYFVAKVSVADGAVLWKRDGPGTNWRSEGRQPWLALDAAGNVFLAGATFIADSSDIDTPAYVGKMSGQDGSLLWERIIEGTYEIPKGLTCDSQGHVLMASSSSLGVVQNGIDFAAAKFAATTGELLWQRRHNGPANGPDKPTAIATDSSDDVIILGKSSGPSGSPSAFCTVKYDGADGTFQSERRSTGPLGWDTPTGLAVDAEDNILVTGISDGQSVNFSEIYTAKYAAEDGAILWDRRYSAGAFAGAESYGVAVDASGDVTVAGKSDGHVFTAKYAASSGDPIWEKKSEGAAVGYVTVSSLALDSTGAAIVAGTVFSEADQDGHSDFLVLKHAADDGVTVWQRRHDGPAQANEKEVAVAIDAAGHVASAGFSESPATGRDFLTRKVAAETGAEIWRRHHNGAANARDEARAVAVDAAGSVVVAGVTTVAVLEDENLGTVPGDPDFYTAKYAAADGAVLWERRYDGPAASIDELVAMSLDPAGNVLVTGYSTGQETGADFYTAKYAAHDGALIWEQRDDGPASAEDRPVALVVDAAGNVVVTGSTAAANGDRDFFTVKYSGIDGSILWTAAYDSGSDDHPTALAVDAQGNVGVAGFITTATTGMDMYTAKYAAATGALLWQRTFSSPGQRSDRGNALAMTAEGTVIVAGTSHPSGFVGPFNVMLMYGSIDGEILWDRSIPDNLYFEGTILALIVTTTDHFLAVGSQDFTNVPRSLVVTAHSLADGRPLDVDFVGTPPGNFQDELWGRPGIAVDGLGRVAIATGVQNGVLNPDPGDTDALTLMFVPSNSAAAAPRLDFERAPSGVWRLNANANPRHIGELQGSPTLTGWEPYGLMVADYQGDATFEYWSNVPQLFLRFVPSPWASRK
jgi:hypothetical protein